MTEQVLVRSGYRAWRPGTSASGYGTASYGAAYDGSATRVLPTGEVLCLIEVPPEYRAVTRQVLRTPEHVVQIAYPAEMGLVSRQGGGYPGPYRAPRDSGGNPGGESQNVRARSDGV